MSEKMNIHEAMLKFHAEFNGVEKSGFNPHFKSAHFTLEDVIHKTTPILHKYGLFVMHQVDGSTLITSIYNEQGERLSSGMQMTPSNNPQAVGSMVTYYRRYNLACLLNIAEKDDDANAAMVEADLQEQRERTQSRPEPTPKPMATEAQRLNLLDFVDSGDLNPRQVKYINANIDKLTQEDAKDLLDKIRGKADAK